MTPQVRVRDRLVDIWRYRELLAGLVRKELKVKYNASVLGFLWSLLNPALTLGIYYLIFNVVLPAGLPNFAIYLMSGLLVYNLFASATLSGAGVVVANAAIVKKVSFPREILPLASVVVSLVFFFFQAIVLIVVLVAVRYPMPGAAYLPELIPAVLALLVLASALSIFLSAVTVQLRDVQHIVEILVGAAWFWATPIVYPYASIAKKLGHVHLPSGLLLLNPLTDIVLVFQRSIYGMVNGANAAQARASGRAGATLLTNGQILPTGDWWWYLWHVLVVLVVSLFLLGGAIRIFARMEADFAEQL